MKYLIIGASVAGVGAIEGIRKVDAEGSITVITNEPNPFYARPLISYYLARKIQADGLYYRPPQFYERNKVCIVHGCVRGIDVKKKTVVTDREEVFPWDKLLLAVGGKPALLDQLAQGRPNVIGFYTLDDVLRIDELIERGKKAVIIGAGLVGMKAAESLYYRGVESTVVDAAPRIMPTALCEEASRIVQQHIEKYGVQFRLGKTVKVVKGQPEANLVELSDGEEIACDLVIVAAGVKPNLDLVVGTDIQHDVGVLVNRQQETNVKDIYAAGDVAQGYEYLGQSYKVVALLPVAYEQGIIAGTNMAGGLAEYRGTVPFNSTSLFGMVVMTGGKSTGNGPNRKWEEPETAYRKLVIEDGVITGFISINKAQRMGIITKLIRDQKRVEGWADKLLEDTVNALGLAETAN